VVAEKLLILITDINMPLFLDCLETLEEIGMEASEDFKKNGGKELYLVPCLNYREDWINTASNWINKWALNNI